MNNAQRQKRMALLKKRLGGDESVTLVMADGSAHTIRADVRHFFRLRDVGLLPGTEATPFEVDEIAMLKAAIGIDGLAAEQFFLLKAILTGGVETEEDSNVLPIDGNQEGEEDGPR